MNGWTADQVSSLLQDAYDRLESLKDEAHKVKEAYAAAKVTYEVGIARATLQARQPAGQTKGMSATDAKLRAVLDCEDEHREMMIAKAVMDANVDSQRLLEKQVDLLRTLSVSARTVV